MPMYNDVREQAYGKRVHICFGYKEIIKIGILHFSVNTLTKNIDSLTRYISKNSLA